MVFVKSQLCTRTEDLFVAIEVSRTAVLLGLAAINLKRETPFKFLLV